MEVIVAVAGLIVIALIAAVALKRRPAPVVELAPAVATQPTLTAAEIREVIREIHGETLRDLAEQAKDDREDAINTAARQVGDAIDHTKKQIDEKVERLEKEIRQLREIHREVRER
jgi:hypothetical protein